MKFSAASWCILVVFCVTMSGYSVDGRFIEAHHIDSNKLSSMEQLPPLDPARHSLPKNPTVPLVPTCTRHGYFRDPFNCAKFYYCDYADAVPVAYYCQAGLIFDTITNYCNHPEFVEC